MDLGKVSWNCKALELRNFRISIGPNVTVREPQIYEAALPINSMPEHAAGAENLFSRFNDDVK